MYYWYFRVTLCSLYRHTHTRIEKELTDNKKFVYLYSWFLCLHVISPNVNKPQISKSKNLKQFFRFTFLIFHLLIIMLISVATIGNEARLLRSCFIENC